MELASGFIFEVFDGSREAAVFDHVGIALELELQREGQGFGERFVLEDAAANELSVDLREHGVRSRFQNVDARDLRFLMHLLGLELGVLRRSERLRLLVSRFQEHLLQHFRLVEILRIALQQRDGRQRALLCMEFVGLLELQQRRDIERPCRINDNDALALLEGVDEVVTVERRGNEHDAGAKEPPPSEAVAIHKETCRIRAAFVEVNGGPFRRSFAEMMLDGFQS